jgi:hypothetical protein
MIRTVLALTLAAGLAACGGSSAAPATTTNTTTTDPTPATPADPASERIGEIGLGDAGDAVIARLGEPASKSEPVEYAATGVTASSWSWPDQGLELSMALDATGAATVDSISVTAPSTLTTSRGIGLGAARADVEQIYGEHQTDEGREQSDEDSLVVGSVYGGTIFGFTDGVVSSIFVGAAAE